MFDKKKKFFFNKQGYASHLKYAYTTLTQKRTLKDILEVFRPEGEQTKNTEKGIFIVGDYILLFLIYILLFRGIQMEGVLKDTIPIGGDIPYHFANYIDLKEVFLPNWEIAGWSDASFGGYTIFQSYPILPFLLIYLLDIFMGSGVAFKIVLLLGAIGLPIAVYWALLQTKVPRPGPIFGAVLSLAYLFHDDHFAFGGNLESIFSGEFTHSLSILFLVLFCGFLFKEFENKKYNIHATLMLAVIGFTHPISFAVAFFLPLFFLLDGTEDKTKGFQSKSNIAIKIILIGGLLFCTWAIGYHVIEHFTGLNISTIFSDSYGWSQIKNHHLIPKLLYPFALLFLGIVIYSLFYSEKPSKAQALFLWGFLISAMFFLLRFKGFAIRFLPLVYLFVILFICATMGRWYQNTQKIKTRIMIYLVVILSLLGIYGYVKIYVIFEKGQSTSRYIFDGAEAVGDWNSITSISKVLSENFDTQTEKEGKEGYPARVFSIYKGDLLRVTSRATLYDSLFSESFVNTKGKWTIRQIKERKISPQKIWSYMELNNAQIIIATQELAEYLENTPYFSFVESFDTYTILRANNTSNAYVVPLNIPVYAMSDLRELVIISSKWYRDYIQEFPFARSVPFLVYDPIGEEPAFIPYDNNTIQKNPSRENCKVKEFIERKKIQIETDCIGQPLLIKFSYHPNWQVIGAKNIYLATPGFMVIVPEQKNVTLFYGKKPYNYLAYACGILGILLLFSYSLIEKYILYWNKRAYKKYREVFRIFDSIAKKIPLKTITTFLGGYSTSLIFIITLIVAIALAYSSTK